MNDRQAPPVTDALDHAFACRWAIRQLRLAKGRRDDALARTYGDLAAQHLDRHLAERRRRLP